MILKDLVCGSGSRANCSSGFRVCSSMSSCASTGIIAKDARQYYFDESGVGWTTLVPQELTRVYAMLARCLRESRAVDGASPILNLKSEKDLRGGVLLG